MRLSTRGRYGTRALLDIALHSDGSPVPLKDIARRQDISLQYLEQLLSPLVRAGIIKSTRGARGGVVIGRPPEQIKLSQVVQLLEGSVAPVKCVDEPQECPRSVYCVTRDVWSDVNRAILEILESTTIQDLVERHRIKEQADTATYYI
ncbi:RrF2 family transcriptional regulator [Chloroflexota bacterium]